MYMDESSATFTFMCVSNASVQKEKSLHKKKSRIFVYFLIFLMIKFIIWDMGLLLPKNLKIFNTYEKFSNAFNTQFIHVLFCYGKFAYF
jgi:hypothetical protein